MKDQRPSVTSTAAVLTAGSALSAAALAAAFVAGLAGLAELDTLLSTTGVLALLVTPAISLTVTFAELWPVQRRAALLALVVLGVLALSTLVALLSR